MIRRARYAFVVLFLSGSILWSGVGVAQVGNWPSSGNDPNNSRWQKHETTISKETASTTFKYLWKIKLGSETKDAHNFTSPLLAFRLINAQGFKDLVLWGNTDTLYAVDSELGRIVWKRGFASPAGVCGPRNLSIVMEPPQVMRSVARRAPGSPVPAAPKETPPATQRKLGVSLTGGFALKGIYVLTGDGLIHELVLTTGDDYAPTSPTVKYLPKDASADSLNMIGKNLFTSTGSDCAASQKGFWALDVASPDYLVSSYATQEIPPLGISGSNTDQGMVYAVTGAGTASGETHANSVVALDVNGLAVKDWYTPEGIGSLGNAAPTVFTYKGRQLIAASGRDGRYVLLDSASLGGSDHHTPLGETAKITKGTGVSFESLANWQDKDGTAWVLASISGTLDPAAKFAITNGTIAHGTIIAFKVEDTGDRITLTPAWTSRDMLNPAPPVIANGTVIALSQGDPGNHARLYVLDAATGQELFSSDESIASYAHHTSVAVGDGHAFFTTHDNTLYSFGIAIEH